MSRHKRLFEAETHAFGSGAERKADAHAVGNKYWQNRRQAKVLETGVRARRQKIPAQRKARIRVIALIVLALAWPVSYG